MVYVYLAGCWSWLNRAAAARERLPFRECTLEMGHACSHTPSYPPDMRPADPVRTYAELDRLRLEPDSERDRRREAYKALQRERARKALDVWFQAVDERDWPLANELMNRLMQKLADYTQLPLHHKGNYGVPPDVDAYYGRTTDPLRIHEPAGPAAAERLCTCPAMEQPHVRNQFTDCNAYDLGGRPL